MPFQAQALPEMTKLRTMQHKYLVVVAHEVFTVFVYARLTCPRKHESKFAPGPDTQQSKEVQSKLQLLSCCEASNYLLSNSMQHHVENYTNLAILQIS